MSVQGRGASLGAELNLTGHQIRIGCVPDTHPVRAVCAEGDTMTELPRIVSVDDHVIEPPHLFSTWLPAKYRDRGPQPLTAASASWRTRAANT